MFEVHPEVPRQERHGQEQDRHEGKLLHALVLVRAHGVEDQVDHAVGGAAHALQRLGDGDAVVFYVAEVGVCECCDGYGCRGGVFGCVRGRGVGDMGGGGGLRGVGTLGEGVGVVLAEGVDEACDGCNLGAQERELGG